ncbi:MAG: hypothetical protein ACE15C_08635 [Phycisphaerae bacterium]
MSRLTFAFVAATVSIAVMCISGQAMAQPGGSGPGPVVTSGTGAPPPPGPWGQVDPEQMKKWMEQFKVQAAKRMQEALGATDEEWKVLQPKIEKLQTLSQQTSVMGMGMGMGRIMFPGGGDPKDVPEVTRKMQALRDILKNKDAKPEEISEALKEYREARAKAKEELAKAQKELKEILTVKQEAVMVTMGLLE